MGPARLRGPRRGRRGPRARRAGHLGPRRARRPQPRLVDHRQRRRRPHQPRRGDLRRRPRGPAQRRAARRRRDDHLHLGHHRAAEGLHAHPRQLHGRAGRGRRRAARAVRRRGRLDAALPAAGPRVRPDHPGGCGQVAHPAGSQRRHRAPGARPAGVPPDVRARGAAGLREGLQHRVAASHRRRPGRHLRPRRRDRDRLLPRARQGPPVPRGPGAARAVLTAGLRQAARRPGRAAAPTPSPGARRSASGWATSTGASG